jgi:formyltetrahydrofolate-dependent phosphoribosylglycinamide formyltransferase
MAAIVSACKAGSVSAEAALVISPKAGTKAVLRAEALGVPVSVHHHKGENYAADLLDALIEAKIDLICLAGYMTLLPADVVHKYDGRILNIHPALLPKFGGKGMYGMHVHTAVVAAGETESGCTVHFVNEVYDDGAVLLQKRCPVTPDDTPDTLADKVLDLEHAAYPEAVQLMADRLK